MSKRHLIIGATIIEPGQEIEDFRGDKWTYHGLDSRDHVIASRDGGPHRTFYPSVFNSKFDAYVIEEE